MTATLSPGAIHWIQHDHCAHPIVVAWEGDLLCARCERCRSTYRCRPVEQIEGDDEMELPPWVTAPARGESRRIKLAALPLGNMVATPKQSRSAEVERYVENRAQQRAARKHSKGLDLWQRQLLLALAEGAHSTHVEDDGFVVATGSERFEFSARTLQRLMLLGFVRFDPEASAIDYTQPKVKDEARRIVIGQWVLTERGEAATPACGTLARSASCGREEHGII